MENRFSLGMLCLPLLPQTECEGELSVLDRLQEVRQQTTFLKNASDYQVMSVTVLSYVRKISVNKKMPRAHIYFLYCLILK